MVLQSTKHSIHHTARIAEDVIIECDVFELGENSYIGPGCKIVCKEFRAGNYLWMPERVDVGRGGCTGPNSIVEIGNSVGIFEGCVINPSEKVVIGSNVGIGAECLIWTHGAWLDPLQGFPFSFESVTIGNNVWLPARSVMLPGTNIGDNCVIGTGSIITKDIPDGSLAMGSPCKVVKENAYPVKMSQEEKDQILSKITNKWNNELLPHKGYKPIDVYVKEGKISFNKVTFDTNNYVVYGEQDFLSEDFRDYLRRHGIRIYNGKQFKSLRAFYETNFIPAS